MQRRQLIAEIANKGVEAFHVILRALREQIGDLQIQAPLHFQAPKQDLLGLLDPQLQPEARVRLLRQ
jgi:hypothetical protein